MNNPQKFSVVPDKAKLENYNDKIKTSSLAVTEKNICIGCSG